MDNKILTWAETQGYSPRLIEKNIIFLSISELSIPIKVRNKTLVALFPLPLVKGSFMTLLRKNFKKKDSIHIINTFSRTFTKGHLIYKPCKIDIKSIVYFIEGLYQTYNSINYDIYKSHLIKSVLIEKLYKEFIREVDDSWIWEHPDCQRKYLKQKQSLSFYSSLLDMYGKRCKKRFEEKIKTAYFHRIDKRESN